MDVIQIMRDAISYPLSNMKNWLIIALLFLITGILQQLAILYNNNILAIVVSVITILVYIMVLGVCVSIMRETFANSSQIPMIDPAVNLVDGVKYLITQIVYYLIPTIITLLISYPVAGPKITKVINFTSKYAVNNTNATQVVNAIPTNLIAELFVAIGVVAIFALILYIIFGLLSNIAVARLAETKDVAAALNIPFVIRKIQSIGIGKYVFYMVLLFVIAFLLSLISALISSIPYVGIIISAFLVQSFAIVFVARATALIYME